MKKITPLPHGDEPSIGALKLGFALNKVGGISKYMKEAFDFKKTGLNKFTINFLNYEAANEYVDCVWLNRHLIFNNEIWIRFGASMYYMG